MTAWLNLIGLIFVIAAINFGTYDPFFKTLIAPMFGVSPDSLTWWHQTAFIAFITISQAILNARGIRIASKITDLSGYLIFVVTIALVVSLLVYSPVAFDAHRLVTFTNFTGVDGGAWPKQATPLAFLSGLLLVTYTITGFDASAHTSEETHDAAKNVPRGIIGSVFWSAVFGYVMVCAFVLVMPDLTASMKQGTGFSRRFSRRFRRRCASPSNSRCSSSTTCAAAAIMSTSRMVYAFARDGGLPASKLLRSVSLTHRTPGPAIWTCAVLAIVVTLYGDAFSVLSAGSAVFLFISYAMPIGSGMLAEGRSWTDKARFSWESGRSRVRCSRWSARACSRMSASSRRTRRCCTCSSVSWWC